MDYANQQEWDKARQDAGELSPQERLLSAIFGEIK